MKITLVSAVTRLGQSLNDALCERTARVPAPSADSNCDVVHTNKRCRSRHCDVQFQSGLTIYNQIGGSLGTPHRHRCYIPQGCPLSVVLLNALGAVWTRAVRAEVPQASPETYADDTTIYASGSAALKHCQRALEQKHQLWVL